MDVEGNKQIIRRWLEAMERGTLDEVQSYWAPDARNYASGRPEHRPPSGREGIAMVTRLLRTAFPDRADS